MDAVIPRLAKQTHLRFAARIKGKKSLSSEVDGKQDLIRCVMLF